MISRWVPIPELANVTKAKKTETSNKTHRWTTHMEGPILIIEDATPAEADAFYAEDFDTLSHLRDNYSSPDIKGYHFDSRGPKAIAKGVPNDKRGRQLILKKVRSSEPGPKGAKGPKPVWSTPVDTLSALLDADPSELASALDRRIQNQRDVIAGAEKEIARLERIRGLLS